MHSVNSPYDSWCTLLTLQTELRRLRTDLSTRGTTRSLQQQQAQDALGMGACMARCWQAGRQAGRHQQEVALQHA